MGMNNRIGRHRGIWTLVFVLFLTVPTQVLAVPIVLDASQRVAAARTDSGGGLCGAAIHFKTQPQPVGQFSEAAALLDKPKNDMMNIADRVTRLFPTLNLRNAFDTAPSGDFATPTFVDAWFPYSSDQMAMPMGDNANIALRLRGFLNVKDELKGKPVTFAVNCNDACSLQIGGKQVVSADSRGAGRVAQQVQFNDSGLYPVEMIYYQNGSAALLEWSRSDKAEAEGSLPSLDTNAYHLLSQNELFSAVAGSNTTCDECGGAIAAGCAAGSFCGNGLCQACSTVDHCGASCAACPTGMLACTAGQCKQCADNSHCAAGQTCNAGTCGTSGGTCENGVMRDAAGNCALTGGCAYAGGGSAAAQLGGVCFLLMLGLCLRRRRGLA